MASTQVRSRKQDQEEQQLSALEMMKDDFAEMLRRAESMGIKDSRVQVALWHAMDRVRAERKAR